MKAFILAAGQGTRMRPLTVNTPKPLLPVAGKPIIQHTIDNLKDMVDEVIILTGWNAKKLKQTVKEDGISIRYVKQDEQLGTADAVSYAEEFIEDDFLCINGDVIILKPVLEKFVEYFNSVDSSVLGMVEVDNPESYGVIKTDGEHVVDIIEKPSVPPSNFINAGIYGFTPEIFEAIEKTEESPRGEYEITDSLKILMNKKDLRGFTLDRDSWIEVSRPWELLSANKKILKEVDFEEKRDGKIEDGVHLEGWVSVEEGAHIKRGSYIQGPVYIGKDSDIGPNCLIRPCTHIDKNCKVGSAVEVKNSIVMKGSKVPHHSYVGDSVIGRNCNFGSGTKVANLRLDEKNITVTHRGERIDTGRRKLGVIMGDNVKTGINSMINTGTIIGNNALLGPGALADGEIGEGSRIK
ncbi:MAG: bifunctional sugar-1-phosphate nucleotidylyltransferase/acetyltransferase [Candidatus Saliniplasma sp.]